MTKNDISFPGDLGMRFLLFRKAIKKTRRQLADDLGIQEKDIAAIEKGSKHPDINYLHDLYGKYNLNINWLVSQSGEMFVKGQPPEVDDNYAPQPAVEAGDPRYEKYQEFFQLMQIPAVEKAILDKMAEVKKFLKKGS